MMKLKVIRHILDVLLIRHVFQVAFLGWINPS